MKPLVLIIIIALLFTVAIPVFTLASATTDPDGLSNQSAPPDPRLPSTDSEGLSNQSGSGITPPNTGGTTTSEYSINPPEGLKITDINGLILRIITWAAGIAGSLAVVMIIYGGYQYVVSGASPDLRNKAKATLVYAIIGLIIIIMAWSIVAFVTSAITEDPFTASHSFLDITKLRPPFC